MSISFSCPCGESLTAPNDGAKRTSECPRCGRTVESHARSTGVPSSPRRKRPKPTSVDDSDAEAPLNHARFEIEPGTADFFAPPPPEIGKIVTQWSSLSQEKQPLHPATRLALVMGVAAVGLVLGLILAALLSIPGIAIVFAMGGTGAVLGAIVFLMTQFVATCSYVGEEGLAVIRCSGSRENLFPRPVFLFHEAAELRTTQTRQYYRGLYTGTDYRFEWTDGEQNVVHALTGRYRSEEDNPGPTHDFHFALSAEAAWTAYLFRNINELTEDGSRFLFRLQNGDFFEIGPDLLIMHIGGKTAELGRGDVSKILIENGKVFIWEAGAELGWFSSTGITSFAYADLSNARSFFIACEMFLGFRF